MSLVGPRPLDLFDLRILKNEYEFENQLRNNLSLKPGLFGLWQLKGERTLGAANLIYWDTDYAKNSSLRFDIKIILDTLELAIKSQKQDAIISPAVES